MSYRLLQWEGDSTAVPAAVFKKLGTTAKEEFFRVILQILSTQDTDEKHIADALHLSAGDVEKAMIFWQGAGLLSEEAAPKPLKARPKHLTTREVYRQSEADPAIRTLLSEAQNIFGEVIAEGDCNVLVSMYVNDHMTLEFLLTALSHLKLEGWKPRDMRKAERKLLRWQEEGVKTAADFDRYLKQQQQRAAFEEEVAHILHVPAEQFTYGERCKIALWYEQFGYTEPMISQAAVSAGGKASVNYLNGILKRWHAKGYRQVRDVLAAEAGQNASGTKQLAPEDDILARRKTAVPKFTKE
ncbi:MAG: DnaD domain protein [Oscillospiraceae bacterium]|nr:DnaD domain protein [Oscillospiraceae bacterium]